MSEVIIYNILSCISNYGNKEKAIMCVKFAGLEGSLLNFIVSNLIQFNQTMKVRYSTLEKFLRRTPNSLKTSGPFEAYNAELAL